MCVISGAERAEHTAKVAKLERELATSQIIITELRQQLQAQMQLQEATTKAAVAMAEKEMEAVAHKQFREGMNFAKTFMTESRQMK